MVKQIFQNYRHNIFSIHSWNEMINIDSNSNFVKDIYSYDVNYFEVPILKIIIQCFR